jgi:DNA-directed RNA polymerase subunit RPC12/RpoP
MSNKINDKIRMNLNDGGIHPINAEGLREIVENSNLLIKCSICKREWLVGDYERTEEEKLDWICPNCLDRVDQDQLRDEKIDQADIEEASPEYPNGGSAEPYDTWKENQLLNK